MNSIVQKLRGVALAALAATAFLSQVEAAPVVFLAPASSTTTVGGHALVDIMVSGLDTSTPEPVGGFSLTLGFNNTLVTGFGFVNDPDAKMGALPLDLSLGFSGGSLDLFFVADVTETQASLSASEGASFRLASLDFLGAVNGVSPLTLSNVVLSNWDGTATLDGVTARNGEICVADRGQTCQALPVPEPASLLLVAAALGALTMGRRRQAV